MEIKTQLVDLRNQFDTLTKGKKKIETNTSDWAKIKDLKNNSREKIHKIAIETSSDLIKQLMGIQVNSSSISTIVNSLSKENKDKYYDH